MKLKVGDLVILKPDYYRDSKYNPVFGGKYGEVYGRVTHLNEIFIGVSWDNDESNGYCSYQLQKITTISVSATSFKRHTS